MMNSVRNRGILIVFEGCDRVGKSTQASKLVESLRSQSLKAELLNFPDRTSPTGQLIHQYLQKEAPMDDHVIHLLFSVNRWEKAEEMKKMMQSGINLIVDRYAFSGVAYSAAKKGMQFEWCKSSDIGLPKPDCVVYMTMPNETAIKRGGFGDEIYESNEFQENVKNNFLKLRDDSWKVITADRSIEEIHKDLVDLTLSVINKVDKSGKDIEKLWF